MNTFLKKRSTDRLIVIALLLFLGCAFLSVIIPPLKSPDEHDHIERAYLLGKGVFILDRPEGKSSGGNIDTGLLEYLTSYLPSQDKLTAEGINSAREIDWTGERVYDPAPGTGLYFPVIYLPQAAGLLVGESLGFTVDTSYRLARALSLFAITLLIFAAFRIYPANPLALALISLPMSLFQFSSASLDGISTAWALFAVATFLRIATDKKLAPSWCYYALAIAVVLLVTSRIYSLPLIFLLAAAFLYARNKTSLFLFAGSIILIFTWIGIAISTTVDTRVTISETSSNIILYYLLQPLQFISVLWQTLSDPSYIVFYYTSFLGILGWLDTPFKSEVYSLLGFTLLAIAVLTLSWRGIKQEWPHRLLLASISIISILLIFFALLVGWSPHPAQQISGVQGRYFLIPLIFLAYSIAGNKDLFDGWRSRVATTGCFLLFVFSITGTTHLLLQRYYLPSFQIEIEKVIYDSAVSQDTHERQVLPSAPLHEGKPISVNMPSIKRHEFGKLRQLGIMFGTYNRQNPGKAELVLRTEEGKTFSQEFSLPDLTDNAYTYFNLPADDYVSGEIRFLSGGGFSAWESHSSDGDILTCLNLLYTYNKNVVIAGCP